MQMQSAFRWRRLLTIAACGVLFTSAAAAQDDGDKADDNAHMAALKACQGLTEPAARLACYDQAVGQVFAASEAGELRFLDTEGMQRTRRRLFGFSLPRFDLFGGGKGDEQIDLLESTITRVEMLRGDAYTFEIAEGGAVWQITNVPARVRPPKVGDTVVFKSASIGSYFIRIDGQTGIKGRRIQ